MKLCPEIHLDPKFRYHGGIILFDHALNDVTAMTNLRQLMSDSPTHQNNEQARKNLGDLFHKQ